MTKVLIALACAASIAAPYVAAETDNRTPTDAFRGDTYGQLLICQLKDKIAQSKGITDPKEYIQETVACAKEGKAAAKKAYTPALKTVSKNKEATKLLKDYYAAWLTAIDGVSPNPSERQGEYDRRQEAAKAKLEEIWNRFEVEAAIN